MKYDDTNKGVLWVNEDKKSSDSPDFSGHVEVPIPGEEAMNLVVDLFGRKKVSKKGKKYIQLSAKFKEIKALNEGCDEPW